ncbi:methyltransferase-like protein 13 [Dorcoceras hygrometricum]|uniref:Methyltransferase-like protein 13 n=1 Tax=Dorcoceras hygrometricum TaxID=472368 RepID=A0A2Z7CQW6_9LAMI|nr:methyltransferase-like protein 13 [Dorcoceras hygrometricum]
MSIHPSTFETIEPSRYITFTIPNSSASHDHLLRIAVLDSPTVTIGVVSTAAMWVPQGRESDWIFSTFSGHLHLLLSSPTSLPLSRLILISDSQMHSCGPRQTFSVRPNVTPLILALTPKSAFLDSREVPEIPFLTYEDEVVAGSILETCEGPCVGEMLIENVELMNDDSSVREFRRRLRFKRMPNLVQTQMRIRPKHEFICEELDAMEFELDDDKLVHPYLSPMVAGISVISTCLDERIQDGFRLKALCLGVGGGALIGFLSKKLDFEVVGVEIDAVVLEVAKSYFGLGNHELIHLHVGDGIKFLSDLAVKVDGAERFDVVMVDLDSCDASTGNYAPPVEFMQKSVLLDARAILRETGVLVINTIPSSESFYGRLISELQVFEELYEIIDIGNEENIVVIATKSRTESFDTRSDTFFNKLKLYVPRSHLDSMRKISKTGRLLL